MNGLGFVAGGPQRFPINGHLRMLHISRFGLQAAWLVSASLLRFPTRKEGSQHLAEQMDIDDLSDPLVCHLAGHPRPFETKAHRQHFPSQTYPLGCSFQAGLSCQFGQHQQAEQDRQRVSLTRFSPGIWQLLQGFVQTWRQVVGFLSIHRRWHEGRIVHGESSLLFHFFECTREALFFGSDVDHMAHISPLASLLFSFLEWECPERGKQGYLIFLFYEVLRMRFWRRYRRALLPAAVTFGSCCAACGSTGGAAVLRLRCSGWSPTESARPGSRLR